MCPMTYEERMRMKKILYASTFGSFMYAMLCTRPYVSHTLNVTSRYQANPSDGHRIAVKNILKYLKRTMDAFSVYGEPELQEKGYANASFQTDSDDSKLRSGYIITLDMDEI